MPTVYGFKQLSRISGTLQAAVSVQELGFDAPEGDHRDCVCVCVCVPPFIIAV